MASQDLSIVLRYLPEKYRKAYADGKLSDDDLVEWGKSAGVITAPKADFSDVQGHTDTVPQSRYSSLPSPVDHALTALDSVQGLGEDVANTLKGATKTFVGSKEFTAADTGNAPLAQLTQGVADQFDLTHGGAVGGLLQNIADPKRMSLDSIAQRGGDTFQEGNKQIEDANLSAQNRVTGPTIGKVATGLASMPSALLGVAGGPSAAIPSADYFTQEYTKARLAGLDHESALNEAGVKAGAMEAVATIPAGSIFGRLGEKALVGDLTKNAVNIGSNIAGEAAKMDLITGSQLGADKWFSTYSNDKKTKDYSTSNLPDDIMGVFSALKDSTFLGAAMGVTRAPHEVIQTAAQKGQLAANMIHGQVSSEKDMAAERAKTTAPTLDQTIPTQGDLFGTPAGLPSHEQFMADRQKQAELDALQNVGQKHDLADKRDRINRLLGLDVTTAQGAQDGNTMADAFRRAGVTDQLAGLPRAPGEQTAPLRPLGEQQNLPLNEPLQPADAETLRKQMADKRARDAAEALVSEDKAVSMDKIKSQHQAERRKAIKSIVENSRGIENHDERIAHVAEATAAWDNENSLASFISKREAEMNKKYKDPRQQYKPAAPETPVAGEPPVAPGEAPVTTDEQTKFDQMKKDLGLAQGKPPSFFASRLKELSDDQLDRLYSETLPKWVASSGSHEEGNPEKAALRAIESERFHRMREKLRAANGNSIRETIQGIKQIPNGTRVDFNHVRDGAQSGRVIGSRMLTNSHDHSKFVVHRVEYTDANGQTKQANVLPSDMTKAYVGPRGLAHEGGTGDTGVTTEHVFNAIGDTLHQGPSKVAAKLIADKNLVVVDSADHIPSDAIKQGTGGYYDGKRTYVVAGELDPNNIMGGLLNVAAHEVKHGADFAASEKVRGNIGNIIGHGANKRLVSKIEALAQSDSEHHPVKYHELGGDLTPAQEDALTPAQKAVHAARIGSDGPTTYGLELPAYFINAARGARDAKSGSGRLRENITAAVRNAAKRRFGDKADVNLNDMAYLSDKLLRHVAEDGSRLTIKDGATLDHQLPMIGGKKATGYGEADSKDRTYMSVDGNRKFVFSDKDARLWPGHSTKLIEDMATHPDWEGHSIDLVELLDHKDLYKNYPEAKDIQVTVVPDSDKYAGYYHNNTISITKREAERAIGDPTGFKKLLLHEVQHWVQDTEGHANGSNANMFMSPSDHDAVKQHQEALGKLKDHADALSGILTQATITKDDPSYLALFHLKDQYKKKLITHIEFLRDVHSILSKPDTIHTAYSHDLKTRIHANFGGARAAAVESRRVQDAAYAKYMRTLGEEEARYTERNHRRSQNELPRNPEQETVHSGTGFDTTHASDSLIVKNGKVVGVAKDTTEGKLAMAMGENKKVGLASFRKKGEGEITQDAYEWWRDAITSEDPETIRAARDAAEKAGGTDDTVMLHDWAEKATKRYLDKYSGTPEDPLKDVVLPSGVRWEDAMDAAVTSHTMEFGKGKTYHTPADVMAGRGRQAAAAIHSFLAHVGDFMLMHVPTAKFGQYDLVRVVKETAANDAAAKKKMEQARAKSSANMPVYKDYKDGFKWVQLTKPGEFAQESDVMGHSVRGYEPPQRQHSGPGVDHFEWDTPHPDWIPASGGEGHLGYGHGGWEGIKSGEAKIYSLRGPDGMSHVTIEVERHRPYNLTGFDGRAAYEKATGKKANVEGDVGNLVKHTPTKEFLAWKAEQPMAETITQVKGKQNEKPSAKYLKYVQDFVKSKDWHGVEDLQNTGMQRVDLRFGFTTPEVYDHGTAATPHEVLDHMGIDPNEPQFVPTADLHKAFVELGAKEDPRFPWTTKDSVGLPFNVKQFNEARKNFTNPDNKAIRLLKSMFSYSGNLGKELNEMREDSTGEAALYSHRGMNAFARINTAISHLADIGVKRGAYKTRAEGVEAFKKQVNAKLESIAKLEDASRREAALAAYVRDNPGMRPVMDAVNEINQLSRTLLIQLVKTHPDPTPEQLRLMNTIHENSFRYATRMYAAFQGEAGREHSTKLIKEYEKGQKALADGKIPEKFKESYNVVNNAIKYLIDNDLSIPDREGMEAADTDKLNNLFTTWVGNADEMRQRVRAQAKADGATHAQADQMVRETLISALEDRAKAVRDEDLKGKSMDIIKGMLDLNPSDSPFATFYRGFAQDRSILEHRERLPQEIKDLFGEIKDPATRLAVTIAKQGELAARTRLLLDMRDHGLGKWVIKGTEAGLPGNERFTVPLKGESYGPLKDYRTTPAIADAIGKNLEMYSSLTQALSKSYTNTQAAVEAFARVGVRGLTRAAGTQKLLSVVFDLYNIGQNFIGSPLGLLANGVVNPKYYLAGLKTGGEVIMDTAFDNQNKLSADYQDAIRYGVLDSARVQEIRATPQRTIRNMISDESKAVRQGRSLARRGARTVVETFAMSDAWIKVSAFKERVDMLTKFYKAEGISKTEEQIKREAADTIKDTTISYSRVPPAIKTLEAVGATTFMPYFYSVPRSISHNYIRGVKDLLLASHAKTTEGSLMMAMSGAQRISGATAATYGFAVLLKSVAAAVNGPDKDKADEMKKLMSEDARFSDSVYVGNDKTNVPLFARFSRVDPFGPSTDIMRVYMNDKLTPEEKNRFALKLFGNLFFSNRITQAVVKEGASFAGVDIKDKKTKIERFAPAEAEKIKDFLTNVGHMSLNSANASLELVDSFVPGIMDAFDPTNAHPTSIKNNDPAFKFLSDMILASGGRLDRADPGLAAYAAGQEVKQARDDGRKRMKDGFAAGSDPSDLVDRFKNAATAEYLALQHASTVYEGMTRGLGYTPRQASDVLKNDGSLTPVDINAVRTGRISSEADSWVNQHSQILSKQSLLQRSQTDEKRMTPDEVKKNRKNINEFLKQMQALGLKVNNSTKKD